MSEKARSGRDAFTFSLRGMRAIASFNPMPVIADDRINKIIDRRCGCWPREDQPDTAREIEDFLARYFAPGCRQAA